MRGPAAGLVTAVWGSFSARRRGRARSLGRPVVSVGNLAFGGRGKTPIVAQLAAHATAHGISAAVLTRGYGGGVGRGSTPVVAVGLPSAAPPWAAPVRALGEVRPAHGWADLLGDEAPWIAAVAAGVPVVVHPDRARGAAALNEPPDLFLLDDGGQAPITRSVDILCVRPALDAPWTARAGAAREPVSRLVSADLVVAVLTPQDPTPDRSVSGVSVTLRRCAEGVVTMDGQAVGGEHTLICGVGDPGSVADVARAAGADLRGVVRVRDHARPTPRALARACRHGRPLLTTEKDAVRWAAAASLPVPIHVLRQSLEGMDALADAVGRRSALW